MTKLLPYLLWNSETINAFTQTFDGIAEREDLKDTTEAVLKEINAADDDLKLRLSIEDIINYHQNCYAEIGFKVGVDAVLTMLGLPTAFNVLPEDMTEER